VVFSHTYPHAKYVFKPTFRIFILQFQSKKLDKKSVKLTTLNLWNQHFREKNGTKNPWKPTINNNEQTPTDLHPLTPGKTGGPQTLQW